VTEEKAFKRRVRERMSKTGESYTAARAHVGQKRDRIKAAGARLAGTDDRMSDAKIKEATGKKWDQWFAILDRSGARTKKHTEIARFLVEERGVPGWWAQSITVWYERARGMRLKHQQRDGFSISASKTMAVPVGEVFAAFVDGRRRKKWLKDGTLTLRTSQTEQSARFDWEDGSTRVLVWFTDKGPAKSTVALSHEKLADPDEAETAKAQWRERLANLKAVLEN
jgi:hypothetical protein